MAKEEITCTLTDKELIEEAKKQLSKLCETGGRSFTMRVPVERNKDTDMIIGEVISRFERKERGRNVDLKNAALPIFDVSNLTIMGLLQLMNEYNKKTDQKIAIGFHYDGVGDICDFSHDVEILIKDFDTLNEAIKFLCE